MSKNGLIIFITVSIIHWVGQFFVWSVSGNSIFYRRVWDVISKPISLMPAHVMNNFFEISCLANSAIWGGAAVLFVKYALRAPI